MFSPGNFWGDLEKNSYGAERKKKRGVKKKKKKKNKKKKKKKKNEKEETKDACIPQNEGGATTALE